MKKTRILLSLLAIMCLNLNYTVNAQNGVSAVFAGGPIYKNRTVSIPELKSSGFTTVIVWTIHIDANGNFNFNGEFPLVEDGVYIGHSTYPNFADDIADLKASPSTVNRVEIGLSAWGSETFDNIKTLIEQEGTDETSTLYKNFQALKEAIPAIDALNFDDEQTYDVASSVQFAIMLSDLGYKVALCPYTQDNYWKSVASQTNTERPGAVDAVFLQCYVGGAGNNPCSGWDFGEIPVYPGLYNADLTPDQVESKLLDWKSSCGINGGFMWLYDEFVNNGLAEEYASAINSLFLERASNPSPANGTYGVDLSTPLTWDAATDALSHDIYFSTNSTGVFTANQTNTTFTPTSLSPNTNYYWRIDEKFESNTAKGELWSFSTSTGDANFTDRTDNGGNITARGENAPNEGMNKAFDNLSSTKWLDFASTSWLQFQFADGGKYACTAYTITSANDAPARDPKSWTLKGSNDGTNWTNLNSRNNIVFTTRHQKLIFTFNNSTAYAYYKFDNIRNHSGDLIQLAEVELLEDLNATNIELIRDEEIRIRNYPNPFIFETKVDLNLPPNNTINAAVINKNGQQVIALVTNASTTGRHTITWDGKDSNGKKMQPGIYFMKITYNDATGKQVTKTTKMLLSK